MVFLSSSLFLLNMDTELTGKSVSPISANVHVVVQCPEPETEDLPRSNTKLDPSLADGKVVFIFCDIYLFSS